ncbi:MAG: hypothetical protein Q9177_004960 [Variospora cf. flavescens]
MAAAHNSDQVVEDYRSSLQDLTANNKHEINFLTMIAKEYMPKAFELSRVLEQHINSVPPDRKLPALYVLDSIAKNVGGLYIHCLGLNLYHTFMNAYATVPPAIRRKLDEMVKTWKEPVPGSTDPRPVFPPEKTRPIETALIKYRTLAVQGAQQQQRQQGLPVLSYNMLSQPYPMATPQPQWQNTGTPPQSNGLYGPPPMQGYPQPNGNPQRPSYPQYNHPPHHPQPTAQTYQIPYQTPMPYTSQPPPAQDLASLHRDIENLISITKHEFAARHWDTQLQTKLKALLDLQSIMRSQQLPPDQIQAVRDQVSQLAQSTRPAHSLPPAPVPLPNPVPTPVPSSFPAPSSSTSQPSADIQSLISSNALADILASAARAKQSTPVPPEPSNAPPPQYPPANLAQSLPNQAPTPSSNTTSLLANLQALGMLTSNASTPNGSVPSAQPSTLYPQQFNPHTPSMQTAHQVRPPLAEIHNDVELTNASLKIPRPHLVKAKLFDARPNQCSTCAQRFLATDEGKKKKARHLDWHFRTNQRLADSAKRIQSRSWYVDEMEWIKSREDTDDDPEAANGTESAQAKAAAEAAKNDPKNQSIPVPSDPALSSAPCPICQEKFEPSWDDASQDFVWRDAIRIQSRVYHASCHAEVKKDGANTPLRTGTPDSVLGKRKAAGIELNPSRLKLPKSPALAAAAAAAATTNTVSATTA